MPTQTTCRQRRHRQREYPPDLLQAAFFGIGCFAGRLIYTSPSRTSRPYVSIFSSAGPETTLPVVISNCEPCHGHWIVQPTSAPSESEPPRCVQWSLKANRPSEQRPTTIRSLATLASSTCPPSSSLWW